MIYRRLLVQLPAGVAEEIASYGADRQPIEPSDLNAP
jgi:hypothetical protein